MDFKNKIVLNLELANKRLKLQGLELNETQLEIIEFCLLSDAEQLKLCEVGVSLLTEKDHNFESWVNNHFKEVNKRFENIINPTVTHSRQDLIIIYGYLGDRKIAN